MKGNIKLKIARTAKGLSQKQMADLLNLSPIAYNMIEMQKINGKIATWQQIQRILDIPDNKMWEIVNYKVNNGGNKQNEVDE